ncbi:hypothetical protein Brsp07_05489 [Brucella sp. NBRC 14130]
MVVNTNWMYQFICMPMVEAIRSCMPGTTCEPISRIKTGTVSPAAMVKSRVSSRRSASFFSVRSSVSPWLVPAAVAITLASYPAPSMAATKAAASALPWIVAFSVARLTTALVTPGTALSAFSTRPTQDAQVMPSIATSSEAAVGAEKLAATS